VPSPARPPTWTPGGPEEHEPAATGKPQRDRRALNVGFFPFREATPTTSARRAMTSPSWSGGSRSAAFSFTKTPSLCAAQRCERSRMLYVLLKWRNHGLHGVCHPRREGTSEDCAVAAIAAMQLLVYLLQIAPPAAARPAVRRRRRSECEVVRARRNRLPHCGQATMKTRPPLAAAPCVTRPYPEAGARGGMGGANCGSLWANSTA
jgi:hypothetical protein